MIYIIFGFLCGVVAADYASKNDICYTILYSICMLNSFMMYGHLAYK